MTSTLRRQSSNAFLIATVIPFAAVVIGLSAWFLHWSTQEFKARLNASAYEVGARLDLYLGQHVTAIESFAAVLDITRLGGETGRAALALGSFHEQHPGFLTMVIADPTGQVIAASPPDRIPGAAADGLRINDREYFKRADESEDAFVSDAFIGRGLGNDIIVAISQGFDWGDGQRGVLEGSLDLSVLNDLANPRDTRLEQAMMVTDSAGRIVASKNRMFEPLTTRMERVMNESTHGRRYLMVSADSRFKEWRVIGFLDRSVIYRPVMVFAGAMAATILASLLIANFLHGRLLGPLLAWIAAVSRSLAQPRVEAMSVPELPRGRTEEMARLAQSVGGLLSTVSRQREELTKHMETLEARVSARTREVEERNRELQFNRTLLEQFVRQAPVSIALFDRSMRFLAISDRWIQEFDLGQRSLIGHRFREVLSGLPEHWQQRHESCIAGEAQRVEEEPLTMPNGSLQWVRWAMDPWLEPDGSVGGTVMMAEFITDRKRLKDQLKHLADHDALTGLLNRRAFVDVLERTLARRDCATRCLLFIDLDDFKRVNDRFGHNIGDDVLRQIGDRLKAKARAGDIAGRMGGDEFVVISHLDDPDDLAGLAARYRHMLRLEIGCEHGSAKVSVSVGITRLRYGQSVDKVLEHADREMYSDKRGVDS